MARLLEHLIINALDLATMSELLDGPPMTIRNTQSIPGSNSVPCTAYVGGHLGRASKSLDQRASVHAAHFANNISKAQAVCSAKKGSTPLRASFGNFHDMDVDNKKVGQRLRAVMREGGFKTAESFGLYLGKNRGAVDSWLNGRALPPVSDLARLRLEHGITLDWLFYGDGQTMQHGVLIRLEAHLMGMDVPEAEPGVGPEAIEESPRQEVARRPGKRTRKAT